MMCVVDLRKIHAELDYVVLVAWSLGFFFTVDINCETGVNHEVCVCVCGRRVLEMCCFMEKMLAHMLTDYEMKLEKEVLEPLNKLSEVTSRKLV